VLLFNRTDRRHLTTGVSVKVPRNLDEIPDFSPLPDSYPEQRETYVANVHRLLNQGGKYLSVCFSEHDPQFGGVGKYRKTALGTVLYYSSRMSCKNCSKNISPNWN
jgi:hypothetical protein